MRLRKRKNNKVQHCKVISLKFWICKDKKCNQFKSRRDLILSIRMFSINSLKIIENNKCKDPQNLLQNNRRIKINQNNLKDIGHKCHL